MILFDWSINATTLFEYRRNRPFIDSHQSYPNVILQHHERQVAQAGGEFYI